MSYGYAVFIRKSTCSVTRSRYYRFDYVSCQDGYSVYMRYHEGYGLTKNGGDSDSDFLSGDGVSFLRALGDEVGSFIFVRFLAKRGDGDESLMKKFLKKMSNKQVVRLSLTEGTQILIDTPYVISP